MTKDEALKLALSTLNEVRQETFRLMKDSQTLYSEKKVWEAIYTIKKVLAQPEQDNTYAYASSLAKTIWQKHYIKESPKFALLDTTEGVLTQIDNMTCGLVREKPAQPEQEPVAWLVTYGRLTHVEYTQPNMVVDTHYQPLYAAPPRREWVGLTDMEVQNIVYCRSPNIANLRKAEQLLKDKNT